MVSHKKKKKKKNRGQKSKGEEWRDVMKRDSAAVRETPIAKEYEADRESVECILTFISALLEEDFFRL